MTTDRTAAYVARATQALTAGFSSKAAVKEATGHLAAAFDLQRDALSDLYLVTDAGERDRSEAATAAYMGLPMELHQWRPKHTAAVAAFFSATARAGRAAERCAQIDALAALRTQILAAPVTPRETKKAAAERKATAIRAAVADGTASPLALAVAPLRDQAVEAAYQYAVKVAERAMNEWAELGWILPEAPRAAGRSERSAVAARNSLLLQFVKRDTDGERFCGCPKATTRYLEGARRDAAEVFDAFVLKLDAKIGAHTAAALEGRALWSDSIVRATLADGRVERWHTQQILNVSKLGKVFPQWPTRLMK